jgi:hypothetical protein
LADIFEKIGAALSQLNALQCAIFLELVIIVLVIYLHLHSQKRLAGLTKASWREQRKTTAKYVNSQLRMLKMSTAASLKGIEVQQDLLRHQLERLRMWHALAIEALRTTGDVKAALAFMEAMRTYGIQGPGDRTNSESHEQGDSRGDDHAYREQAKGSVAGTGVLPEGRAE